MSRKVSKAQEHVSDHAVLRWLQRNSVVDVEAVRQGIYDETRSALNCGAKKVTVNGIEYRLRGGKVTTLIVKRRGSRPMKWGCCR